MAGEVRGGGERPPATRVVVDDRERAKARALRRDRDWDAEGTAEVSLPAPLARRALIGAGYVASTHGGWVGPGGGGHPGTEGGGGVGVTAAARGRAPGDR